MTIWDRITAALSALASGEGLGAVFDRLRTPPEQRVGFTIAVIGLGAKMAKADGTVSRSEVAAFREVFHIRPQDEAAAARVFDLARQDVAGFEEYARRIRSMFEGNITMLETLLEGLFHIAIADGAYHPAEDDYLTRVAQIFGLRPGVLASLRQRHVPDAPADPWQLLGVPPDADAATVKRAWRRLVRETHPDRMIARGLPEEAVRLGEKRLIAVNRAYEAVKDMRSVERKARPA
ncbi:MAG: TerB family tellurite resistance protein [Parerythrobacter sp.]